MTLFAMLRYRTKLSIAKDKRIPTMTGQSLARPDQLVTCFSLTSTQRTTRRKKRFQDMTSLVHIIHKLYSNLLIKRFIK